MTPKPDTGTQVAIDNARLFEEMESTNRRLFALNRVAQTVNQSLNLRETLAAALDATLEAVEVDAGNIRLWDEQEGVLTIATHRGMSERYIAQRRHFKPGEGIGGKVFQRGEAFLVEDMREYPHLNEMAQEEGVRSVASIPIRSRDKMVGVISIFGHGQRRFTPPELELLTAIGNQIGTALENARLFETIAQGKREWESTFDAIADGIVLLDERGTVLRANRAFGFWWKTPAEALTGASWHDLWDQLGVSSPCPHCEAWSTKRPASAEAHVSTSNRSLAFAAFLLQAREPSPSKSFAGTILVIRDITERKRAEEALRRTHDEMERGVQERTAELSRAIDILQPDTCAAGGLSECKKIADMASAFGVRVVPHVWGSAIGLAAALQLLAVLPRNPPGNRPLEPMLEFDRSEHPFRQAIVTAPIEHENGVVQIPDGPGLGIEIDRAGLERFRVA